MSGFWAVFWLAIILKIPIAALFFIIWWACASLRCPRPIARTAGVGAAATRIRASARPSHRGADRTPIRRRSSPGRVRVAHRGPRVPGRER